MRTMGKRIGFCGFQLIHRAHILHILPRSAMISLVPYRPPPHIDARRTSPDLVIPTQQERVLAALPGAAQRAVPLCAAADSTDF